MRRILDHDILGIYEWWTTDPLKKTRISCNNQIPFRRITHITYLPHPNNIPLASVWGQWEHDIPRTHSHGWWSMCPGVWGQWEHDIHRTHGHEWWSMCPGVWGRWEHYIPRTHSHLWSPPLQALWLWRHRIRLRLCQRAFYPQYSKPWFTLPLGACNRLVTGSCNKRGTDCMYGGECGAWECGLCVNAWFICVDV